MAHWRPERPAVGYAGNDHAFCALYRGTDLGGFSSGLGGRRGSWLDNGAIDCRAVPDQENHRWTSH